MTQRVSDNRLQDFIKVRNPYTANGNPSPIADMALDLQEARQQLREQETKWGERFAIERAELTAEREAHQATKRYLGNLLARIHRDGGHYQSEHGTEKAACDAEMLVCGWLGQAEQIAALTKARDGLQLYADSLHLLCDGKSDPIIQGLDAAEAREKALEVAGAKLATSGHELLQFIRDRFPADFVEGGKGFTCPHHLDLIVKLAEWDAAVKGEPNAKG